MTRVLGSLLILLAVSSALLADAVIDVPEIHGGSAPTAFGLLSGALLIFRSRRRR